jgi:hypothetical protein
VPVDDVGDEVKARAHDVAGQHDHDAVCPQQREQHRRPDADLERPHIVQQVPVIGEGNKFGERSGREESQMPNASAKSPLIITAAVTPGRSSDGAQGEVCIAVCLIRAPFLVSGYS